MARETQASFFKDLYFSLVPAMFKEKFFKNRSQSQKVARECLDRIAPQPQNDLSREDFEKYIPEVFKSLGLVRKVSKEECEKVFDFYDDKQENLLTKPQVIDLTWDIYTSEILNDRVRNFSSVVFE